MKIKLGNLIQLVLSLSLGVGLVYWFINQMTQEEIDATLTSFSQANYFWLIMSLLVGFLSNIVRGQRWRLMLRPVGYYPGFWNTFFSINVMFFANLFIPRLGEVSRCGILAKYEKVPVEKSIGTMVVERVIDLICLLSLLGLLLLLEYDKIIGLLQETFAKKEVVEESSNSILKYGLMATIAIAVIVGAFYIYKKHGLTQLKITIRTRLKGLIEGFVSVRHMNDFGQFVFLTIVMWACYIIMPYLAFFSLAETSHLGIVAGMGCMIFGGFAMVATPGGIGAYPLAVRAMLALYGINEITGGALGTMLWGTQTLGVFLSGIISLILLALMNPSKK
ncbi:MAG: flippase-like domain-containing protein [Chitinophagales bacterium]|nr:flippase-like domain-containing protein [Chitinophagales bacterium]